MLKEERNGDHIKQLKQGEAEKGRGRNNKKWNSQKTDINIIDIIPTIVSSNRNILNTPIEKQMPT